MTQPTDRERALVEAARPAMAALCMNHGIKPVPGALVDEMAKMLIAVRAVEAAMMRGGDGRILDHGWNITKLNEARPLIHAALTQYQEPSE